MTNSARWSTLRIWTAPVRQSSAAVALLLPLAVAFVTARVFLQALPNGFIDWDDGSLLLRNVSYRGFSPSKLAWMFITVRMGHWMPLNRLSFGRDHVTWGMNPAGYHLTNDLLGAVGAPVFFCVALSLMRAALPNRAASDPSLGAGALVAALAFGIHPLGVESVA